jgi:LacI family transcriptional regulator
MTPKKTTLSQIAKQVGMAKSTVSYALRDDPRICKATRLHIQEVSRALGYRPDPVLGKLMSHLHGGPSKRHTGQIAFINLVEERDFKASQPTLKSFHEGAGSRADELGYQLADHWFHEPGVTPKRLAQILINRGVRGILLGSTMHFNSTVTFPWENFAAILVGYSVAHPPLSRVVTHHYRNTWIGIRHARAAGCRRLGFVINKFQDDYMDSLHTAAVLTYQAGLPADQRVAPLILPGVAERDLEAVAPWFRRNSPDVILCAGMSLGHLQRAGIRIPEDVPGIELLMSHSAPEIAGVHPRYDLLGAMAVDLLVSQLHHDEFGIPKVPKIVQTEGLWHAGESLRVPANSGLPAQPPR